MLPGSGEGAVGDIDGHRWADTDARHLEGSSKSSAPRSFLDRHASRKRLFFPASGVSTASITSVSAGRKTPDVRPP